jgi:hypothetical protein
MSHEILGERFYGHREAGWHHLGHVSSVPQRAGEVYINHIQRYEITLEPIMAGDSGLILFPDRRAIVRHPMPEDDRFRCFEIVSDQYGLVTPDQAVALWDRVIDLPVETMAVVRDGKCLLITAQLPTFDVKGDEVKDYIGFHNWMDGSHQATMLRSPVRQVCMNTMRLAESLATETYRARHTPDILARLEEWLTGFVDRAIAKQQVVKEACELLAVTQATQTRVLPVLSAAYPEPLLPSQDVPTEVYQIKLEEWERERTIREERRATVLDLFMGQGMGSDTDAFKGTMWGIYQSVVELENYRRGGSDRQAAESVLVGERGDAITRSFDKALEVCRN